MWERESLDWLPDRSVAVLDGRTDATWTEKRRGRRDRRPQLRHPRRPRRQARRALGSRALVLDESHYVKNPRRAAHEGCARAGRAAAGRRAAARAHRHADPEPPRRARLAAARARAAGRVRQRRAAVAPLPRGGQRRPAALEPARALLRAAHQGAGAAAAAGQAPRHRAGAALQRAGVPARRAGRDRAGCRALPLDLRTLDAKVAAALRAEQLVRLNNLRQLAAHGKLPTALAWIGDFLASGEPLVVFAEHIAIQRAVLERFPDAAHILGADSTHNRQTRGRRLPARGRPAADRLLDEGGVAGHHAHARLERRLPRARLDARPATTRPRTGCTGSARRARSPPGTCSRRTRSTRRWPSCSSASAA